MTTKKSTKSENPPVGNMDLWNLVCETRPSDTKEVNLGRKFTAIDPYSQIREATRVFGPAGSGWGWCIERVEYPPVVNQVAVLVVLWHGESQASIQQWGQNGLFIDKDQKRPDNDSFKKATTDGLTKCLSYLGFNADVFLGKFDDSKYVAEMARKEKAEEKAEEKKALEDQPDDVRHFLQACREASGDMDKLNTIRDEYRDALATLADYVLRREY